MEMIRNSVTLFSYYRMILNSSNYLFFVLRFEGSMKSLSVDVIEKHSLRDK